MDSSRVLRLSLEGISYWGQREWVPNIQHCVIYKFGLLCDLKWLHRNPFYIPQSLSHNYGSCNGGPLFHFFHFFLFFSQESKFIKFPKKTQIYSESKRSHYRKNTMHVTYIEDSKRSLISTTSYLGIYCFL